MTELNFDSLDLIEIPVTIKDEKYILREANGSASETYRNASMKGLSLTDGKVSKIEGLASLEALLVSLCLFKVNDNGVQQNVGLNTVKSWPNRVIKPLFNKAKEISELDEEETVESIDGQIEKLQARREELLKEKEGND